MPILLTGPMWQKMKQLHSDIAQSDFVARLICQTSPRPSLPPFSALNRFGKVYRYLIDIAGLSQAKSAQAAYVAHK